MHLYTVFCLFHLQYSCKDVAFNRAAAHGGNHSLLQGSLPNVQIDRKKKSSTDEKSLPHKGIVKSKKLLEERIQEEITIPRMRTSSVSKMQLYVDSGVRETF